MKILVPVKSAVDYNIRVHVNADGSGIDTANLKHSMNPFDEIALEEAIRMKEAGKAAEIITVSIGGAKSQEVLRHSLALGAEAATHISHDAPLEPLAAAKLIGEYAKKIDAQLVLVGKQAIDDDYNQTGQMLAAYLDWPQATFVSALEIDGIVLSATREIDTGLVIAEMDLPAVVTVDLRLNQPRYASLPNIMKAKSKPIETLEASGFGVDLAPRLTMTHYEQPQLQRQSKQLTSVDELIDVIKQKMAEL